MDIDWVSAPDTEHSMLNLLTASSDLPDIIWADPKLPQIKEMATRGVIWALDELAEKNAPKFMDHYDKRIIVHYRMLFESMNFFVAPCFYMPGKFLDTPWIVKNYAGTTVVQQLYEELGSPKINTADDYLNLLRQVKKNYPDMIPASSARNASPGPDGGPRVIDKLLPVAGLAEKYFEVDGGWVRYWEHPDFLHVLKIANTLYNERLIDPAELTDKDEQIQAKIFSGRVFSEIEQDSDNVGWYSASLQTEKPEWNFVMIPGFTVDPSTMDYEADSLRGGIGGQGLVVPKTDNAARAIRWIDFLFNDQTQKELIWGLEGGKHKMVNGLPTYTDEYLADQVKVANEEMTADESAMKYGFQYYWALRDDFWARVDRLFQRKKPENVAMDVSMTVSAGNYKDLAFYQGFDNFATDSEEAKAWGVIKDFYGTEVVKIVTGSAGNVESAYKAMISKMKDLGLDTLNAYWTKVIEGKSAQIEKYSAGL